MMCSTPVGSGGALSGVWLVFSEGRARGLADFRAGDSLADIAGAFPHQDWESHAAQTFVDPTHNKVAIDTPTTSAARLIARSPSPKRLHPPPI
jgi:hypothetical protein